MVAKAAGGLGGGISGVCVEAIASKTGLRRSAYSFATSSAKYMYTADSIIQLSHISGKNCLRILNCILNFSLNTVLEDLSPIESAIDSYVCQK